MKKFMLIGERLSHSISPQIHKSIMEKSNIIGSYELYQIEKDKLYSEIDKIKKDGINGINVTIPYKVDVMNYIHHLSQEAKSIGAVNTILFNKDYLYGYNTDYFGFGITLDKFNIPVKNRKIAVLGTGGASKAVIQYIKDKGAAYICSASRSPENLSLNASDIEIIGYRDLKSLKGYDIIINSTPCGMYPHIDEMPIDTHILSNFNFAIDLIYNPKETLFLKSANKLGLKAVNGLYMLIGQAVKAQEIWNDINISYDIINSIYDEIQFLN